MFLGLLTAEITQFFVIFKLAALLSLLVFKKIVLVKQFFSVFS